MNAEELVELQMKRLSGKQCIVCGKRFEYTHDSREFCKEDCYLEYNKDKKLIKELKSALKDIIAISDRKHDAWDKAKELIGNE